MLILFSLFFEFHILVLQTALKHTIVNIGDKAKKWEERRKQNQVAEKFTFFFYFSGHGGQDKRNTKGPKNEQDENWLFGVDASKYFFSNNLFCLFSNSL